MKRAKTTVTPDQFRAAREAEGLTLDQVDQAWGLNPGQAAAIEAGVSPVPDALATVIPWTLALRERERVIAASGLPECNVKRELASAAASAAEDEKGARYRAIDEHVRHCAVCKAREEFGDEHAPPIPDLVGSHWIRWLGNFFSLLARLPGPLAIPDGDGGDGRRTGIAGAFMLSTIPLVVAVIMACSQLFSEGWRAPWWRQPLRVAIFVPIAYLIAGFLTGWMWDLTRRIGRWFIGYVVRDTLAAVAIYGTVGVMMPLFDPTDHHRYLGGFVLLMATVGALGGAGYWVWERLKASFTSRAA